MNDESHGSAAEVEPIVDELAALARETVAHRQRPNLDGHSENLLTASRFLRVINGRPGPLGAVRE